MTLLMRFVCVLAFVRLSMEASLKLMEAETRWGVVWNLGGAIAYGSVAIILATGVG